MKRILLAILIAIIFTPTIIQSGQAGTTTELSSRKHPKKATDANANHAGPCVVSSRKTKANARVGCAHAATFQAYVDDLESGGATIYFMGGTRRGKCWSGGLHPCGKALDVCQLSRGRVAAKCNLPGPKQIIQVAARHGLTEGAIWCHSDYGHAQVGMTAGPCGSTMSARRRAVHEAVTSSAYATAGAVADWRGH